MIKLPNWIWLVVGVLLLSTTLLLKYACDELIGAVGFGGVSLPFTLLLILLIATYLLLSSKKDKKEKREIDWTPWKQASWSVLKYGALVCVLVFVFSLTYKYRSLLWVKVSSWTSGVASHVTTEKKWYFHYERSHDDRNWNPNEDSLTLNVTMLRLDSDGIEFLVSRDAKPQLGRRLTGHFKGMRLRCAGRRYGGTWTHEKPGDPAYIHDTWELDMINENKFVGYHTASGGSRYYTTLERR